jgi:hypothetical protein
MPVAIRVPRRAIERRACGDARAESAAYMAATSMGPIVAKNVVNARIAVSTTP